MAFSSRRHDFPRFLADGSTRNMFLHMICGNSCRWMGAECRSERRSACASCTAQNICCALKVVLHRTFVPYLWKGGSKVEKLSSLRHPLVISRAPSRSFTKYHNLTRRCSAIFLILRFFPWCSFLSQIHTHDTLHRSISTITST